MGRRLVVEEQALIMIIDDIYNVYGTLEELELCTNAVESSCNSVDYDLDPVNDPPPITLFKTSRSPKRVPSSLK
ncbi:hypothetical protein RJ639_022583 [Escallonia herrerae]|uniref:Terpene synthase metal-binding domain-containing protein n=1 Tax=Escallonia herrerae TaxID=1293975 RepID=A0AA88UYM2_9ASTE|nr:hypothetical protein RJ639_022583 [Escallonia herrerae]